MRIGIYDPYLDSLSGGEKYMLTAACCLSSRNDVAVFWDDKKIADKAVSKLKINLSGITISKNIFSPSYPFAKRLLETRKYDIILILSDGSIPLTLARKTILHFQHPVEWVKTNGLINGIKLSKISQVICNSLFTKKFIDKKFNIKSKVLYPPCTSIDSLTGNPKFSKKKNIILTVGRYSTLEGRGSFKKFEVMIENFKKMIDEGLQNWQFILAISFLKEKTKNIEDLKQSINNYPVKIIQNCSYDDLGSLYNESKIYWHAAGYGEDLELHPENAEHFGITTVEALSRYVVPVVYSAGGQREIIDDNINGFLWETKEELQQKTKRLMQDDDLRIQMAKIGINKIKQFTAEKFCEELHKIINS